jgi:HK97 family phage prohead protease
VTTLAVEAPPDTGTFSGYLAAFGRDLSGDTITGPGAVAETVAAVNRGAIIWHLTDAHSSRASDIVATVTGATTDEHGVKITARWGPTARAQELRQMVKAGHALGLSIDYLVDDWAPDGRGGRHLNQVTIVGGAITPQPMNPGASIVESKTGAPPAAPIVGLYDDIQRQAEHNDPQRLAEDRLLAAASWPPPGMFDRETRLALIRRTAEAKAHRELEGDPARARAQARRDRENEYSNNLRTSMAQGADRAGCRCQRCRWDIPGCVYG